MLVIVQHQMKVNQCHSCVARVGCEEKKNPCTIGRKESKKVIT